MKDVIKTLNKHTLSIATGISYNKLRKYSAGEINSLTKEEGQKICEYLVKIAEKFKT